MINEVAIGLEYPCKGSFRIRPEPGSSAIVRNSGTAINIKSRARQYIKCIGRHGEVFGTSDIEPDGVVVVTSLFYLYLRIAILVCNFYRGYSSANSSTGTGPICINPGGFTILNSGVRASPLRKDRITIG